MQMRAETSNLFEWLCRVQLIFYKDNANREQRRQTCLNDHAKCRLSGAKILIILFFRIFKYVSDGYFVFLQPLAVLRRTGPTDLREK